MKPLLTAAAVVLAVAAFAATAHPAAAGTEEIGAVSSQPSKDDLPGQFRSAAGPIQVATFKAKLDRDTAKYQVDVDQRVDAATMSRVDLRKKVQAFPKEPVASSSSDSVRAAMDESRSKGKEAYLAWIEGKKPEQIASAKKLYAAWLTMLDAMVAAEDPDDVWETPAGTAYSHAVHEFEIDALSP